MIKLLKCEYMKTRRRYIFLTAAAITLTAAVWAFYGDCRSAETESFFLRNGWLMYLYQLPLVNTIFFPLISMVIASRLCDLEHRGSCFKQICVLADKGLFFDAKLIYGLGITLFFLVCFWAATLIFGKAIGFHGEIPLKLYFMYLIFTIFPTIAVYIFQHSLSMICKNQAVPFFIGIFGEFIGLFSMFLPSLPILRKCIPWGYYGALQFVGLYGWTKEERYANAYFSVFDFDWLAFGALLIMTAAIYLVGRKIFCKKEI